MSLENSFNRFAAQIADSLGYDRDSLTLIAELRTGGPTVMPGPAKPKFIESLGELGKGTMPYGGYDSLGSKHIEFRVIERQSQGKVNIERPIYSFQHHPLPGNCRISVNRWVQVLDDKPWSPDLLREGLRFRAAVSRTYGYRLLLVSTGASFQGAEPLDEYELAYKGAGRSIYVLDVSKLT